MIHVSMTGRNNISPEGVLCVVLCHNEMAILPEFLRHYRFLGITSFAVVDDRSSDGSREFLLSQDDVTMFAPRQDSLYKVHKAAWRNDILNTFGIGRWCLNPDVDEHFVYFDMEARPIPALTESLDQENSKGLLTIMIDMYADLPIRKQIYDLNGGRTLLQAFPYFDGPTLGSTITFSPRRGQAGLRPRLMFMAASGGGCGEISTVVGEMQRRI